ncbi:hypothetical protein QWZ08_00125 [Ferruginibacter paludis]|uniref:hypothetical protein n=1 Tax=Ferruginibacter paludis TaxID=1310417 RepID=UPI0025B3E943|nr:hypothetical protein [Ferruginibacter paludis]MDN3654006.1 hypothetical protein [Ferruginibacter paludis]
MDYENTESSCAGKIGAALRRAVVEKGIKQGVEALQGKMVHLREMLPVYYLQIWTRIMTLILGQ